MAILKVSMELNQLSPCDLETQTSLLGVDKPEPRVRVSSEHRGRTRYYQPTITLFSVLILLLLITLGLIGLTEYACRKLPSYDTQSIPDSALRERYPLSVQDYVFGGIMPTVIGVAFTIPWLALQSAIAEMEPFYQLTRPGGAEATDSICLLYLSSATPKIAIKSMLRGHHIVCWSSIISLLAPFLAPLSGEAIYIHSIGSCSAAAQHRACVPVVVVEPAIARVIQGILAAMAVLTLLIAGFNVRRKSGIYANPQCIAGTATLCQDASLLELFRRLDSDANTTSKLLKQLEGFRFHLDASANSKRQPPGLSHGITISSIITEYSSDSARTGYHVPNHGPTPSAICRPSQQHHLKRPWKSYFNRIPLFLFGLVLAAVLILIVYYNQTGSDTPFERFMDSQSFGPKFVFTGIGVIIKLYWRGLDNEYQRLEPYRALSHKASLARNSVLFSTHSNPFTALLRSVTRLHLSAGAISFLAILCEPLTIALSNIPFSNTEALTTYQVSNYFCIATLSLMLIAVAGMLFRKPMPALIRPPDSIASVLLYLCGSRMLKDFDGMVGLSTRERDYEIKRWGKRYMYGQVVGVDDVVRTGVDYANYVTKR